MEPKIIMLAIRDLREHVNLSQTEFASRVFNKTLPTQQRFESLRPPKAEHLSTLVRFAREHGRDDLAEIFKQAVIDSLPPAIRELILEPSKQNRLRDIASKRSR